LQFQVIGHPEIGQGDYVFTPTSRAGATSPKLENLSCRGESLTDLREEELFDQAAIDVSYLIKYYDLFPDQESFFSKNLWIDKLAGTDSLRLAIIAGTSHQDIKSRWQEDLEAFKLIRSKYLLYPDF
ncbi:MAG: DUF1343 domain-containing protein, partial [Saprospiraceae bacterium]|nr:DUF1343 domain-containing protein [Saprospiraceae bacterium]